MLLKGTTEMLKILIRESRRKGLKVLFLQTFENNVMARHVCEKVGFKETGRRPKIIYKNGKYIDDILMAMELS